MKHKNRAFYLLAAVCIAALALVAVSAQLFPNSESPVSGAMLEPPSARYLFGTDNLGRDLLARSFNGLRLSLMLAVVVQIFSVALGILVGIITGYFGGMIDKVYVMLQNMLMSFPSLIASLCMIILLGTGLQTLVIALVVTNWITYARIIRGEIMMAKELDYVRGSKAIGTSTPAILFRHILPNIINPIIPLFTLMIGHTILSISGLGFLGFGVQPPKAEMGLMMRDGLSYIGKAPWMFLLPGVLLVLYSLLINITGDKLQDRLNPQNELYLM